MKQIRKSVPWILVLLLLCLLISTKHKPAVHKYTDAFMDRVNMNLQEEDRKLTLDQLETQVQNRKTAPSLLHANVIQQSSISPNTGLDMRHDPRPTQVHDDLVMASKDPDLRTDIVDDVGYQMRMDELAQNYNQAVREEVIQTFQNQARRQGVLLKINNQGVVVGIQPIARTPQSLSNAASAR